ncbi:MAG TPA: hypothetical protein VMV57_16505, partial [Terracidiphilus sp.]|nr:hypothetical protein [Terracidiphilus sp.]
NPCPNRNAGILWLAERESKCRSLRAKTPKAEVIMKGWSNPTSAIRLPNWRFFEVFVSQVVGNVVVRFQKAL